jgi:hypothetical protein
MGLLPMDIDLPPPSGDRIFKLLLTSPEGKPALIDLISATLRRQVVDAAVRDNELPNNEARRTMMNAKMKRQDSMRICERVRNWKI